MANKTAVLSKTFMLAACTAGLLIVSCKKDPDPVVQTGNLQGMFILNEGSFGSSNGSVTFVSRDGSTVHEDLFSTVNKRPLGDVVQSMTGNNGRGFIVVNNSQKVEVVNLSNFVSSGVITGFSSPRHILPLGSAKAYVTDWFADRVAVVNLNTYKIASSIPVGSGPEQLVLADGKVFVCNVGGFGTDSTVSVIDPSADAVIATLQVGINPNSMVLDKNGILWVLCGGDIGPDWTGGTADDTGGSLVAIDPSVPAVIQTFLFGQFNHPLRLTKNGAGENLFFLHGQSSFGGNIRKFNINVPHSTRSNDFEQTTFGRLFILSAIGSFGSAVGQ
jgi:YVTN family beta-propeller protein